MGAGRCFGVTLEAKCGLVGTGQALQGSIKQRHMGGAQVGGQGFFIHRKTMVLAGDGDTTRIQVFHRVVGAMVAKLHLEGFGSAGQGHDLVAQTNTKGGNAGFDQFGCGGNGVVAGLGVTRAVGQENTIGLVLEHIGGGRLGRHHRDLASALRQHAQNVFLHAKVICDHMELRCSQGAVAFAQGPFGLKPFVGLRH